MTPNTEATVGKMGEPEFCRHVLAFVESAVDRGKAGLDCAVEIQAAEARCRKSALEANTDARSAVHALRGRLASLGAKEELAKVGLDEKGSPRKVLVLLIVVGSVSLLAGYGPARSEVPMKTPVSNAGELLTAARLALADHGWDEAYLSFGRAKDAGADPEECFAGMAQCKLRLGEFDLAVSYCDDLTRATKGKSTLGFRLRGCVEEERGNAAGAKRWYAAAEAAGDVKAGALARRVK